MRLASLLEILPDKIVNGRRDLSIRSVVHDSRMVRPGDMFIAIREPSGRDGHRYIPSAVERGAVAIVHEHPCALSNVTMVQVPNSNNALAMLADYQYGHPAQSLTLVGVTGTNGKTTVTCLIEAILCADCQHTGSIGTAGNRLDMRPLPGPHLHTTPYPNRLQELLRAIVDQGGQYAVMEVSSHALALDRVVPLTFRVAVFTNLTRDHLDYHRTFDAYCNAKLRLFRDFLHPDGVAVINIDDPSSDRFLAAWRGRTFTYSLDTAADITLAEPFEKTPVGSVLSVRTPAETWRVSLPLIGRYNVSNALAAIGTALALDIPPEAVTSGIGTTVVPGRLERVECGQPFLALVDYAHTPDALGAVLSAVREWTHHRLIVVFGCGGDRDRGKRPQMGEIASRLADEVIITSDNPRTEPPEAIITEVEAGVRPNTPSTAIVDRRSAIADALSRAGTGDAVVVAGKGHETYQEIGAARIPFDDRDVIRSLLREHAT